MVNKTLDVIWQEVPKDYYQRGVASNILQKIWHLGRLRHTIQLLRQYASMVKKQTKVLDIGCASGWFISEIAKAYPIPGYVGIDVYKDAILYAKELYPAISFRVVDAHKLPFKSNAFDVVICMNVLEHVVNPNKIMEEIKRVLKPGGIILIGMDSENAIFTVCWSIWKKFSGKVWKEAHLHTFNPAKLDNLFKKYKLTIQKKKFIHFGMAILYALQK